MTTPGERTAAPDSPAQSPDAEAAGLTLDSPAQSPDAEAAGLTAGTPAGATIDRLADDLLPALIARLDASDLGELEVRTDTWRVRLRKPFDRRRPVLLPEGRRRHPDGSDVARSRPHEQAQAAGSRALPGGASASALRSSGGHAGPGEAPDTSTSAGPTAARAAVPPPAVATSPAVGYFNPRDGWTTGHRVRSGDVLGWVDCLGVRQDVLAPVDGHVGRLLAQPGEAVEYGQPLVHVDLPRPVAQPASATPPAGATPPSTEGA